MGVMLSPIEYEHRPRPGTHRGPRVGGQRRLRGHPSGLKGR